MSPLRNLFAALVAFATCQLSALTVYNWINDDPSSDVYAVFFFADGVVTSNHLSGDQDNPGALAGPPQGWYFLSQESMFSFATLGTNNPSTPVTDWEYEVSFDQYDNLTSLAFAAHAPGTISEVIATTNEITIIASGGFSRNVTGKWEVVPDNSSTAMLLGSALVGLFVISRRRVAKSVAKELPLS